MADQPAAAERDYVPAAADLTLGSASPRRAELVRALGINFAVEVVDIDEQALVDPNEQNPHLVVETIAAAKFAAFATNGTGTPLLTADTLVACDGSIMGKPDTPDELTAMLKSMSGSTLQIATAVCVGPRSEAPSCETVTTEVELRELTAREIHDYVATGVGMDKAGGLALQSHAKPFIHQVRGCWSNVLGLPLCATSRLLGLPAHNTMCSAELCGSYEF